MAMLAQRVRPGLLERGGHLDDARQDALGAEPLDQRLLLLDPVLERHRRARRSRRASSASGGLMGLDREHEHVIGADDDVAGQRPWPRTSPRRSRTMLAPRGVDLLGVPRARGSRA